jgi:hypothetical protein
MEAEKSVQQKQRELREAEMATKIALEERNKELVGLTTGNAREEADARAYALAAVINALSQTDAQTLQALTNVGMQPAQLIALAFKQLAESTDKIGQLNISPDLLQSLLTQDRHS